MTAPPPFPMFAVRLPKPGRDGWRNRAETIRGVADANGIQAVIRVLVDGIEVSFPTDEDAAVFRLLWPGDCV